jgi:pimeloyl-ACP methyl ester carboxylesterase
MRHEGDKQGLAHRVSLPDGCRVGFADFGDPNGVPMLYCHGFPASRLEAILIEAAALRYKVRIIAPDRPGYGLSDFKAYQNIRDWSCDIDHLLAELGVSNCLILAISGGAPYALAYACKNPLRVLAVGIVSGMGPLFEPWATRQMKWVARVGFFLARNDRWLLSVLFGGVLARLLKSHPTIVQELLMISSPRQDKSILVNGDIREAVLRSMQEAAKQGPAGMLQDFLLYSKPWGFELEEVVVNIKLWHGLADTTVPLAHAVYYSKRLKTARLTLVPDEGHISLPIKHIDSVLEELTSEHKSFREMRSIPPP